jgi:hypothetical protein
MVMSREWKPLCYSDSEPLGTSSDGFVLPCCFCDKYGRPIDDHDPIWNGLFDEELKIENNNSINDILYSDQWKRFYGALSSGPESSPMICQRTCWREIPIDKKSHYE